MLDENVNLYVFVDIAEKAIQKAKEKGLNVFVCDAGNRIPFEDNFSI